MSFGNGNNGNGPFGGNGQGNPFGGQPQQGGFNQGPFGGQQQQQPQGNPFGGQQQQGGFGQGGFGQGGFGQGGFGGGGGGGGWGQQQQRPQAPPVNMDATMDQIDSAEIPTSFLPRLPIGLHKVIITNFRAVNTLNAGTKLECDFMIAESNSAPVGGAYGWPWFINSQGWGARYEQGRAKEFMQFVDQCVGNNGRTTRQIGADLASGKFNGLQLSVQVSQQYEKNGAPKMTKKGEPATRANWTPIKQTMEDVEKMRASLGTIRPQAPAQQQQQQQQPQQNPYQGHGGSGMGQFTGQPQQGNPFAQQPQQNTQQNPFGQQPNQQQQQNPFGNGQWGGGYGGQNNGGGDIPF